MGKYEKYAEYKDSGVNYFGEIPSDWKVLNLRYVFDFLNEKRFPLSALERESKKGIYPYYGASGIIDYVDEYLLDEETILIAEDGANLLSRSTPLAFIAKGKYWVNNHAHILKPKNLLFNFWTYFLQSLDYTIYITCSAQPKLSREKLGEVIVLYPSLEEQTQIANFLDHETAKIDSLIEKQQQLIELLKEKRQAVISHAVTKGLNPNVPMKDSGVEWLGEVPEHWDVIAISKLTQKITNGYVGPTRDILVEEGIPYVQATHIKKGKVNFDNAYFVRKKWSNEHSKSILKKGDVLIVQTGAGTGDIGLVSEDEEGFNCHALIILQPKKNQLLGNYLAYVLQSDYGYATLYSIRTGGMHPHLNCGEVQFVKIPVPGKQEQKLICEYIEATVKNFNKLIDRQTKAIQLMQERRTALISAAVTGKIDVRNWQNPTEARTEFSA